MMFVEIFNLAISVIAGRRKVRRLSCFG